MTTARSPAGAAAAGETAARRRPSRRFPIFPCLADRETRSNLCMKLGLVLLHVVLAGAPFLLDEGLRRRTRDHPWFTIMYFALLLITLAQYFITSITSPGYVVEAMRASTDANRRQTATRHGNMDSSNQMNNMWMDQMKELYPSGLPSRYWTCTYCNVYQPPRTKHCHDCDQCVLQFDHHCTWLGTCIGKGNHCLFWWYLLEETILSGWTSGLYISFLCPKDLKAWWMNFIAVLFLVVLVFCFIFLFMLLLIHSYLAVTNQTTYELMRRQRIFYFRGMPTRARPFDKGTYRNLSNFCCPCSSKYTFEAVPPAGELQPMAETSACIDIVRRCF